MIRPQSLAAVSTQTMDRASFHLHLRDFLDEFRRRGAPAMLSVEPRRLAGLFSGGDVADAYLAAVARIEHASFEPANRRVLDVRSRLSGAQREAE